MERRSLALATACGLLVAACAPAAPDGAAGRESERVIRTLFAAMEFADTAAIAELLWPQATWDDFQGQSTFQGVGEIIGYLTAPHVWGDDVYLNIGRVLPTDGGAVAEWVFSAVQNRPIPGLVEIATGREVVLNGVTIVELDGDRIIRGADYMDTTPMMLQVGGRVELPGGVVLQQDGGGG